jgi:hypothetical protein
MTARPTAGRTPCCGGLGPAPPGGGTTRLGADGSGATQAPLCTLDRDFRSGFPIQNMLGGARTTRPSVAGRARRSRRRRRPTRSAPTGSSRARSTRARSRSHARAARGSHPARQGQSPPMHRLLSKSCDCTHRGVPRGGHPTVPLPHELRLVAGLGQKRCQVGAKDAS